MVATKIVSLPVMKYYFIAGEPSGNLHAVHLMEAVRRQDADAVIRYWYRPELAYMGFVSVVLHLPQILRGMADCKSDISAFAPDKLVLVDYPGFNLKIASWFWNKYIKGSALVRKPQVVYYIPPKIWAWKEKRIEKIRRYVDVVLSILPFEVEWYRDNYGFHVDYVGNPTLDEIKEYLAGNLCRCTGYMGQLRAIKKYMEVKNADQKNGREEE